MAAVRIYLMGRGVDIWRHLCQRCLEAMEAEGWTQRQSKEPPKENPILACDGAECLAQARQGATP